MENLDVIGNIFLIFAAVLLVVGLTLSYAYQELKAHAKTVGHTLRGINGLSALYAIRNLSLFGVVVCFSVGGLIHYVIYSSGVLL